MSKKMVWITLLFVLSVAACRAGNDDEESPTPIPAEATSKPTEEVPVAAASDDEEPVIISFAVFDFEQGRYNDLIDAFEEENPGFEIRLVSIEEVLDLDSLGVEWPEDARLRLVSAADVSAVFYTPEAAQQGLLLDLGPLMENDGNFDANDFYGNLLEQYQSGGGTWALPTEANVQLIFFNKDAFDELGVDYPEAGWSWDEFLATAQDLTIRDGDEVAQWGFVEVSPNPAFFVESRTGPLFNMDTDPPTSNLDNPDLIESMRWYSDLFLTHQVSPYFPQTDDEAGAFNIPEGYSLIEGGKAAMWPEFSGAWEIRGMQMNIGAVPFPVDAADSRTSTLVPGGLSISAGTSKPDAAWLWLSFLSLQASELGFSFGGGPTSLPALQAAAEASGFWDDVDEELGDALDFALDHAYSPPSSPQGYDSFFNAFEAIVSEEKAVEDALLDAHAEVVGTIEGNVAEQAEATPVPEIVVAEPEAETAASEDAVTIEFMSGTGLLDLQTYRDLAKQFLELNPDIIVEIKQPDFFDGVPNLQDIAAASDCFQWPPSGFNDPENLAAILSLDAFFDDDPSISEDDFFPTVLDPFTAQGQTWGLPAQITISLIEYNKDMFDDAGIAYPSLDWTTDDFLTIAVALTQGEDETKQYGYVSDLFEPAELINLLDRLGARMVDDNVDPPNVAFNTPETIEAVRWYTSLTTEHAVKPILMTSLSGAAATAVQEWQSILMSGRAAMWASSGLFDSLGIEGERSYDTGVLPLPVGRDGARGGGYLSVNGYYISAETEARQACWQWVTYLTEQPNAGAGLPARRAVAETEAYRQQVGPEKADAYLASIENANQPPFALQFSDENSWLGFSILWLYGAYDQILNEGISVEDALDNAQELAETYRACVIADEVLNDEEGQEACAQETDPSLPAIIFGSD